MRAIPSVAVATREDSEKVVLWLTSRGCEGRRKEDVVIETVDHNSQRRYGTKGYWYHRRLAEETHKRPPDNLGDTEMHAGTITTKSPDQRKSKNNMTKQTTSRTGFVVVSTNFY